METWCVRFRIGMISTMLCVTFFFQAEDGIRDYKVTGVQTCALPISRYPGRRGPSGSGRGPHDDGAGPRCHEDRHEAGTVTDRTPLPPPAAGQAAGDRKSVVLGKRVDLGGRRIIKKKKTKAISIFVCL